MISTRLTAIRSRVKLDKNKYYIKGIKIWDYLDLELKKK